MALTHEKIEKNLGLMVLFIVALIIWGGLIQIVPLFYMKSTTEPVEGLTPYTPLRLVGRDIYVREGCFVCHSQMVRPFRAETERYGHYSLAGEYIYDHPFQWGSKRTGPDLHRVGGRYSDDWHRVHMVNPRDVVPESIMPGYPWLEQNSIEDYDIKTHMQALIRLGHPYTDEQIEAAPDELKGKTELDAMVAYLQGLGVQVKTRR